MVFEVGQVCVKTKGRLAGNYVVVVKKIDETFVEVTGPKDVNGVKRKRSNIKHLVPTNKKVKISEGASDEEVKKEIEKEKLMDKFKEGVKISI